MLGSIPLVLATFAIVGVQLLVGFFQLFVLLKQEAQTIVLPLFTPGISRKFEVTARNHGAALVALGEDLETLLVVFGRIGKLNVRQAAERTFHAFVGT